MATAADTSRKRNRKQKKSNKKSKTPARKATATVPVDVPVDDGEQFTFFFRKQSPFSQWHPAQFTVSGVEFSCAEQFMMYQKAILFNDNEVAQEILDTHDPREHKGLGRKVRNFDEKIWNREREKIVHMGNLAKFSQNLDLWEKLKATEGTTLVEASPFDRIWGIGLGANNEKAKSRKTWRGRNLLGAILTRVREEISNSSPSVVAMETRNAKNITASNDAIEDQQLLDLPKNDGSMEVEKSQEDINMIPELPPPTTTNEHSLPTTSNEHSLPTTSNEHSPPTTSNKHSSSIFKADKEAMIPELPPPTITNEHSSSDDMVEPMIVTETPPTIDETITTNDTPTEQESNITN